MPIEFVATSRLPTAFGEFNITVFQDPKTGEEHVALSKGLDQPITEPVLVRVHSECLTGDAFASLKHALPSFIAQFLRGLQLWATVTLQGRKGIARETFGMNTD